jgi:transposase
MARTTRELTDAQWAKLAPLLPPQRPRMGRPPKDHRLIVEAIVWLDRTAAPWRDLPSQFGPWETVASRSYRWRRQGIWDRVLAALQADTDARGRPGHGGALVDPDQPGDRDREALGSRGGSSTKLHLRVEGRGRPRIRPAAVAGDKGYSHLSLRRYLRRRGIRAVIPPKSDQPRQPSFDKAAYRQRNHVERMVNRLKGWRRVATRYEKGEVNYLAMVTIAAIVLLWLE